MIPDCSWHRLLIATETTATEITATGTTPTEGTSYSTTTFSSAVISSAPEQGCSTIHSPGNGTISCDDEKCRITCDPGHVPWQLRFTPETCQTVTRFYTKIETKIWKKKPVSLVFYFIFCIFCRNGKWSSTLTDQCLSITEICELNLNFYTKHPDQTIQTWTKNQNEVIHTVSCQKGFVNQGTQSRSYKMRCVCRYDGHSYKCRKNKYFGSELGDCVDKTHGNGDSGRIETADDWLDMKRLKFSHFMRALYDTFWMGAEGKITHL